MIDRLSVIVGGAAVLVASCATIPGITGEISMYGLIGKMTAQAGQRLALATILIDGGAGMPGCLSYIVAEDPVDANALWITEVWIDQAHHKASLSLPSVQEAIRKGRPL
ncbi:MAG: antibiotic biosynthesis monooxygenase, partial [Sphingomonas bacterium]|nr:antibiotic biosynthesis monooxygenase [Sphingomonas bacterium]